MSFYRHCILLLSLRTNYSIKAISVHYLVSLVLGVINRWKVVISKSKIIYFQTILIYVLNCNLQFLSKMKIFFAFMETFLLLFSILEWESEALWWQCDLILQIPVGLFQSIWRCCQRSEAAKLSKRNILFYIADKVYFIIH